MEWPPPTYLLLVALTLAAWPLVRRKVTDPGMRQATALLLGGLLAVETGLAVLFWSRLACVPLVVAGCLLLARVGFPASWRAAAVATLPAALAAAVFVAMPETQAYAAYFAVGLPLSLLAALAAAMQRWLRWTGPRPVLPALAAFSLLAGLVPFASFALAFGELFEVWQAPPLAAALAALAWLATRGQRRREAGRDQPTDPDGVAYAGDPGPRLRPAAAAASTAAGLALAVAGLLLAHAIADPDGPVTQPRELALLGVAGAAATAGSLLATVGLAGTLAARARRRFHATPWAGPAAMATVPAGAVVEEGHRLPDAAALDAFRGRLRSAGGRLGVLVVAAPGPLATLGEEAEAWLAGQSGPVRVHVALREGPDAFLVPPILPGEAEP